MTSSIKNKNVRPKKSWGQNFLQNEHILENIAQSLHAPEHASVIELGAGMGALTKHLLKRDYHVIAIERDRNLIPILEEEFHGKNIRIQAANAATLKYEDYTSAQQKQLYVVGNLPYNLSSRILVSLSDAYPHISEAVLLVQKEVAQRLCSPPGSKTYGLLSVLVQRSFTTEILFPVKPEAFFPKPKVDSALVRLRYQERTYPENIDSALRLCAKAAFSSRRKTLTNSIAGGLRQKANVMRQVLETCSVNPQQRAERLELKEFVEITEKLIGAGMLDSGEK